MARGEKMRESFERWWVWSSSANFIKYIIIPIIGIASFIFLVGFGLVSSTRAELKYNCNLNTYPSYRIALMINTDPYAYDPVGFCNNLKQRMEKK